jgi:hypothetical protein
MTLIYALGTVLLLSATVALVLTYSSSGAKSELGMRNQSNGRDFSELCEEAVINLLSTGQSTLEVPSRIAQQTSAWPTSGAYRKSAVDVSGWLKCSDSNAWTGGQIRQCYECSFEPDATLNGTVNQNPGESLTTTYYKVTSIHDTGQGRIHYQTTIAINR